MAGKIFISYRRDASRYQAQRIYEAFVRGLPRENIFMDVDAIPLGVNFVKVLEGWVEQCDVLLVLMGAGWANSTDSKTGKRRLDNQKDFVRIEIRGALTRDIPVVPVLLDGAELPEEAELPDDIKGLLNRNAEFVEYRTFDADVQRLIRKLRMGGSTKQGASPAIVAGTQRDQAIEEHDSRSSAEGLEAQGDLADKPREKKTLVKEWTKGWLTPTIVATVFLAAAAFGTLVFWPPGLLSGKRLEITAKGADSARQAAEAQAANAEKARQAAEARAADAEKARQAAEAKTADAEKARQAAEAKTADAEKARQAAEGKAVDAEKARQTAQAQTANAEKIRRAAEAELQSAETARQAAEAKIADAEKAQRAAEAKAAQIFSRPTTNMWIEGSSTISADSVGECEQLCARNQTCKAYSYNRSDGMCLHSYRSETHMAPKSGWICAVRIN